MGVATRIVEQNGQLVRLLIFATGALLGAAHVGAAQPPHDQHDTAKSNAAWRADSTRRDSVIAKTAAEMRRLAEMHMSIPEYHDEQRLRISATAFGPVVNVFASPFLGDFTSLWQIQEQGARGMLVAFVVVDTTEGMGFPITFPSYNQLALRGGMNCLWLSHQAGAWVGEISHAQPGKACSHADARRTLRVRRQQAFGLISHADYPPVARITETTDGRALLGVKCLNAWCDLGPNTAWTPKTPSTRGTSKQARVKGWHDEQWLAEPGAGGILRPSAFASVVPVPGIEEQPESWFNNTWRHVATIKFDRAVSGPLPTGSKYFQWGLRDTLNRVELRKTPTGAWQARVTPAAFGTAKIWPNVGRIPHQDARLPGTARWRWTTLDDGFWVACGMACCRADGYAAF